MIVDFQPESKYRFVQFLMCTVLVDVRCCLYTIFNTRTDTDSWEEMEYSLWQLLLM